MFLIKQDKHKCWRVGRGIQGNVLMLRGERLSHISNRYSHCRWGAHGLINKKNFNLKY